MKQLIYGAVGLLFTIMTIFSITTLAQVSEREAEIKTALPNAVQSAVETTMEDGKYKIDDQKKFIAVFTKNLSDNINTGSGANQDGNLKIDVKVAGVDTEKGLLSVEATEYYSKMNGKIGQETCSATVLMDKTEKAEVKRQTSKVTFKFDDGTVIWEGAKDSLLDEQPKELSPNPTDAEKVAYEDAKTKYQLHVQDQIEQLIDKADACLEERFVVVRIGSTGERKYIPKENYDEYKTKYLVNGDYTEENLHPLDPKDAADLWEQTKQISPTADINFVFKGSSAKSPEPVPHTIIFNGNGGKVNGQNVYVQTLDPLADGTVITLPSAIRTGCDFKGWYKSPDTNTPISDTNQAGNTYSVDVGETTIYAQYEGKTGQISYNLNNGSMGVPKTSFNTMDPDFTLQTPVKDGYTFLGWTGSNGDIPQTNVTISPSVGKLQYDFVAAWKENTYTVTLNGLNGAAFSCKNPITKRDKFVLGSPDRRGYEFLGWTGEGINTPTKNVQIQNTDHNLIYTANWQEGNKYYVTLQYTKDKSALITVDKGTGFTLPDYSLEGKYLTGVYDESGNMIASGNDIKNSFNIKTGPNPALYTPTKMDTTLTYKWEPGFYTVKFDPNGGTGVMPDQKVNVHEKVAPDQNKFKFGDSSFDGWSLTKNGPRISDSNGTDIFNDLTEGGKTITVYARWMHLYGTLTVNNNDGTTPEVTSIKNGTTYIIDTPAKDGYTFVKWNLTGEGKIDGSTFTAGGGDTTLTAEWKINTYSLSMSSISGYGTANLYINGNLYKTDMTEIHEMLDYGTAYKIVVRGNGTYTVNGNGIFDGVIHNSNVTVTPNFKLDTVPITVQEYITNTDGSNASLYKTWNTSNYTIGSTQTVSSQGISGYQSPGPKAVVVSSGSVIKFYHTKNIDYTNVSTDIPSEYTTHIEFYPYNEANAMVFASTYNYSGVPTWTSRNGQDDLDWYGQNGGVNITGNAAYPHATLLGLWATPYTPWTKANNGNIRRDQNETWNTDVYINGNQVVQHISYIPQIWVNYYVDGNYVHGSPKWLSVPVNRGEENIWNYTGTKAGYTFRGWYSSGNNGWNSTGYFQPGVHVSLTSWQRSDLYIEISNMRLDAVWQKNAWSE